MKNMTFLKPETRKTGRGSVRLHKKYGYDLDRVPLIKCFSCGEPIGNEEYVEETVLSRFGQMFFRHKRCHEALKKKGMESCGRNTERPASKK